MSAPYRPGQSPWPENQPRRPDRPPPIQFHEGPPPGGRNSALDWTLRILGLVAVAVISGFAWWFFTKEAPKDDPTGFGNETTQQTTGEFEFTQEIDEPVVDDSCGEHAYGQIQDFLNQTPCERLTRSLFTTEIDGRTVYTSVSVVRMADKETATELRELTDTDNTGNVNDLVREGEVPPIEGLETLSGGGGYDSSQNGTDVIIVESDYDPAAAEGGTEDELDRVCTDAIRLATEMTDASG